MTVGFSFEQEYKSIIGSRLLKKIGQYNLNIFLKNYTMEGYLKNGVFIKWKPLSDKYKAIKERKKPGYSIGVYTTKLKQGFNIKYNSKGFAISNTVDYADDFNNERPILYQDVSIDNEIMGYIDVEVQKIFKNFKNNLKK